MGGCLGRPAREVYPSAAWSNGQLDHGYSQNTTGEVHRYQHTQPAGQMNNFLPTATHPMVMRPAAAHSTGQINRHQPNTLVPIAELSAHGHGLPAAHFGLSHSTSSIDHHPTTVVPRGAKMRIVETGPIQCDCQIRFLDPSTDLPLNIQPIELKRNKSLYDDGSPSTSTGWKYGMKSTGVLCRADGTLLRVTVSGWKQDSRKLSHQLNNTVWTDKALEMCPAIGHNLERRGPAIGHNSERRGDMDHGTPGKFEASHVEKQLLAYVYAQYEETLRRLEAPHPGSGGIGDQIWEGFIIYVDGPGKNHLTQYHVTLTNLVVDLLGVCNDCLNCAAAFTNTTGIRVTLYVNGQLYME